MELENFKISFIARKKHHSKVMLKQIKAESKQKAIDILNSEAILKNIILSHIHVHYERKCTSCDNTATIKEAGYAAKWLCRHCHALNH